jgi:hypothetical protein
LLWHLGGAQSDVAALRAEDIDWKQRVIIAWAGWNHLQEAQALAEYYITAKDP